MTQIKILHITDPHFVTDRESFRDLENLFKALAEQEKEIDIILFGGDYEDPETFETTVELAEALLNPSLVAYILGNNDLFEKVSKTDAVYIDADVKVFRKDDTELVIAGISRNVAFKPRQYKRTISQYEQVVRHIRNKLTLLGKKLHVLLIHDVPLEIAEQAVKQGHIDRYNTTIVSTVSRAIRILNPTIVYTGHLHAPHIHAKNNTTHIYLTCWTQHRTLTLTRIDTRTKTAKIQILRHTNNKPTTLQEYEMII